MPDLQTERLRLTPFAAADFNRFVESMLTDPRVVEFYYSYRDLDDIEAIRRKAQSDFWDEFEDARRNHGLPVWTAYEQADPEKLAGWCGLLHGELSEKYAEPELQYLIAGDSHGRGLATELAHAVVQNAFTENVAETIVATVDIPNTGSINVLEKLGFVQVGQVHAYGSDDMYLYRLSSGRASGSG